jgi:hypothetical protein
MIRQGRGGEGLWCKPLPTSELASSDVVSSWMSQLYLVTNEAFFIFPIRLPLFASFGLDSIRKLMLLLVAWSLSYVRTNRSTRRTSTQMFSLRQ